MDFSILISGVLAFASLMLGFFVVVRKPRKPTNVVFAVMCFAAALWVLTNGIVDISQEPSTALFWGRLTILGPLFIPSAFLLLANYFPDNSYKPKNWHWLLYLMPIVAALPFIFTEENISSVSFETGTVAVTPGRLYIFLASYLVVFFIIGATLLLRKYRTATGVKQLQIRYVFLGVIVTAAFGTIVNLILPLFGINVLQSIGSYSTIFLVSFIAYSIVRHRLMDVRLLVTRSVVYAVLLSVIALAFVLVTFLSAQYFSETAASSVAVSFFVAALIVFGIDPLKRVLSSSTDKIFFKARVDYQLVLRKLSETLSYELDQNTIITNLRHTLTQELKVKFAATLLRKTTNGGTEKFEALPELLAKYPNMSVRNDSALIRYLREHRHPAIYESLERKIDDTKEELRAPLLASKDEFEKLGAALISPIYAQDHLIAVLVLGPKLSGDTFSNDDVNLIEVLSPQIGSAIQKANLFEEVRQFGENLKVKVQEATEELQERNVSLQTLQNITKEVTRTLDFSQAVQNIANSVATELGYLGAILVFLDEDGRTVRARAITETPLTKKALQLLPHGFEKYQTDLNDPKSISLGHQVIRSGEIKITDSMSDVLSPPLPRILASSIQKLIGLKSMVLVPIISESKTIGVIEIGLQKAMADITPQEIATMQSMADELGIVSRNLTLFSQLRATNDQLEVANKHLQELDRAKSEFVSIASHQLRTPMTGIMGYLSMMTQGDFGKIKPEHQKILTDLLAESQRMIRLINQFLNVSKIEAGKFTYTKIPVQLEDLIIREIKETTKAATDKGLKLVNKLPKTLLPKVMADADKLQDVILNLIDNAIKYTDKGTITVGAAVENNQMHFWVKDSGIGIKPQDATELFNKFVRGSGIAQIHPDGSGLGLFIAKSIIDAHGGRIWAESEGEGKGSTFQFMIPMTPSPDMPDPHPHQAAAHVVTPRSSLSTK